METEQQRLDRLNRNIARKRALWRVEDAIKAGFSEEYRIRELGLAKPDDIALALRVGLITNEANKLALLSEIKEEMWRELEPTNEKEEKKQKLIAPLLPGCKCRNADQSNPLFWLFTGWQADGILDVATYLESVGVNVSLRPNGNNGNYQLRIPLYVKGEVVIGAESQWKDEIEEEIYVVNSITSSTETSFEAGRECIYQL